MCDDYSYFRWRELHKSAMMTETAVLLPIEAREKNDLREYQVVVIQTCFLETSGSPRHCCSLLNASIMTYPGWGGEEL